MLLLHGSEGLQVAWSNSLVRVASVHRVERPAELLRHLRALEAKGAVSDSRRDAWKDGAYQYGADWLTAQGMELLGIGDGAFADDPPILPFELRDWSMLGSDICSDFTLLERVGNKQPLEVAQVCTKKCGVVLTRTPVAIVWIDLRIKSNDPRAWLRLARARQRVRRDEKIDHHKILRTGAGETVTLSDILRPLEEGFLPRTVVGRVASARNFYTFGRYQSAGGGDAEVRDFQREAAGKEHSAAVAEPDRAPSALRQEVSMPSASGMDMLAIFLQDRGKGAQAFTNAFKIGDLWLPFVVCVVQAQLIVGFERQMLDLAVHLDRLKRLRWFGRLRGIIAIKRRYEAVMDDFMQCYWRYGLIHIHSHERRHRVYLEQRDAMSLDRSLESFHQKLTTLGSYLAEQQKDVFGWFLLGVPFVSLLIGFFGINVKGYTASEGLQPVELALWLGAFIALYFLALLALRWFFAKQSATRSAPRG